VLSNRLLTRTLTALVAVLVGPAAHTQRIVADGTLIQNVTLISPERAAPLLHADVVIRDGRIAEVSKDLVAGPQVRRIDGSERFLIQG
jgi:hypothetical protein